MNRERKLTNIEPSAAAAAVRICFRARTTRTMIPFAKNFLHLITTRNNLQACTVSSLLPILFLSLRNSASAWLQRWGRLTTAAFCEDLFSLILIVYASLEQPTTSTSLLGSWPSFTSSPNGFACSFSIQSSYPVYIPSQSELASSGFYSTQSVCR